jgi:MinD-like ATPase involved in chromosome partitioning or flagellar assembly
LTRPSAPQVPRWPTITAAVHSDGSGEVNLTPATAEPIVAASVEEARQLVLSRVAAYAAEHHGRAVRLSVRDPDGEWILGVNPDGTGFEVEDQTDDPAAATSPQERDPAASNGLEAQPRAIRVVSDPAAPPPSLEPELGADESTPRSVEVSWPGPRGAGSQAAPRSVDRHALHARPPGALTRFIDTVGDRLKDPAQREEEELDRQFARRYVVTETNLPVVVSPKGGPGKTTVAVIIGDALAARLSNQRVAAIDFNPGGGALEAVPTEDRAARFSMLQLHRDRGQVRSHAQLQAYVASLSSGLDLLAVPPDPSLALSLTPEHYAQLFDRVLLPNYNVLVLDTSPDITSPVTQLALRRGTQMIIVLEQGYISSGVVLRSLPYLLAQPAAGADGSQAIVVINRVMSDPRAGALEPLREEIRTVHSGPIIEIPWDLDLRADIDSGGYSLDRVKQRATRLALKRLALHVAESFA